MESIWQSVSSLLFLKTRKPSINFIQLKKEFTGLNIHNLNYSEYNDSSKYNNHSSWESLRGGITAQGE